MKYLVILISLWAINNVWSQTDPNSNSLSMEQMMIQAMKEQGMSQDEIDEAIKATRENMGVIEDLKEKGVKIGVTPTELKIPSKQLKLLNGIPVLTSDALINNYLSTLLQESAKNTKTIIIAEIDKILSANPNDKDLGIMLFLKGEIHASVYASIKLAQNNSGDLLVQNNLAFVLNQSGYPQKAIPLFQSILNKEKDENIANNLAQCYLALGDIENARKYFIMGLAINPNHCEMNCGMGLIESNEGNIEEATKYISKSLQNGYTVTADELAKKHKVKLNYNDVKSQVPEYFNPQKHKPVDAARNMEEVLAIEIMRESFYDLKHEWSLKNEELKKTIDNQKSSKLITEHLGYISNTPFARKALFMLDLVGNEIYNTIAKNEIEKYRQRNKAYYDELDKALIDMYNTGKQYDNEYEACVKKVELLNLYLEKSKINHDQFEREMLPKYYDWTNQELYWQSFLISGDSYKIHYTDQVLWFLERIEEINKLQTLYPTPDYIAKNCKDYQKQLEKIKLEEIEEQLNCPVSVKFGGAVGSFKMNCKGYELEGGELGKLSFEENFKTGEFQLAFGLGADVKLSSFTLGSKGMMYFRFAKDFSPVDMGIKGEAGIEAQAGAFNVEEKITGTMGISSINIDAVHLGKESNIFNMDATKD